MIMIRDGREDVRSDLPPHGYLDDVKVITPDDMSRLQGMVEAIRNSKAATHFLNRCPVTEVSGIIEIQPPSNTLKPIKFKVRWDRLPYGAYWDVLVDLKTTSAKTLNEFGKSIYNFGYMRQAAAYMHAAEVLTGRRPEHFVIIAVQNRKRPPFGVATIRMEDHHIKAGWDELMFGVHQYAKCEQSGNWPCFPDEVVPSELPEWAERRLSA